MGFEKPSGDKGELPDLSNLDADMSVGSQQKENSTNKSAPDRSSKSSEPKNGVLISMGKNRSNDFYQEIKTETVDCSNGFQRKR